MKAMARKTVIAYSLFGLVVSSVAVGCTAAALERWVNPIYSGLGPSHPLVTVIVVVPVGCVLLLIATSVAALFRWPPLRSPRAAATLGAIAGLVLFDGVLERLGVPISRLASSVGDAFVGIVLLAVVFARCLLGDRSGGPTS
jgi:hypothetical protein